MAVSDDLGGAAGLAVPAGDEQLSRSAGAPATPQLDVARCSCEPHASRHDCGICREPLQRPSKAHAAESELD